MLSAQNLLPRLPVPKLTDSLGRFIRAAQPLLSSHELAETKSAVADFVKSGVGAKLQARLERHAANTKLHDNWLSEYWLNGAYLEYRDPLLFSNPSSFFPPRKFSAPDDQFRFAAAVISAALAYRTKVINHEIPPEIVGRGRQLCMFQYTLLFDNCRIPAPKRDRLWAFEHETLHNAEEADVVLMYRNKLFNLKVDTRSADPQTIYDSIISLKKYADSPPDPPVGIFTSWHRDKWAVAHQQLKEISEVNALNLKKIERSAFVMCLDTQPMKPISSTYSGFSSCFDQALHGGGSMANTGNRWFDKTVQLIIGNNGAWGSSFEHSAGEAFILVALNDYVNQVLHKNPHVWKSLTPGHSSNLELKQLKFKLNPELRSSIATATKEVDTLVKDVDSFVNFYDGWGRDDCVALRISADALVQMAFQLAYYRMNGVPASCYETGSSRRFLKGRTDTIRPCSIESLALCEALTSKSGIKMLEAKRMLMAALASHTEYLIAAVTGRAYDRHFFGLRQMATELGIPTPKIFTSPGYTKTLHQVLSTSQVSTPSQDAAVGYVPLVHDGYGSCYNIAPNKVIQPITSWYSCPTTDSRKFGTAINDALAQLFEIASSRTASKKSTIGGSKL